MAFSWKKSGLRHLKKLKYRYVVFMKNGKKSDADRLDARIKRLKEDFG